MTTAAKSQGQIDRESMGAIRREATFMDVEVENREAFARHTAGWVYSEYVGEFGGWSRTVGGSELIVCSDTANNQGPWSAFVVRERDGKTLAHSTHPTYLAALAAC